MKDYLVVIDGESEFGRHLLALQSKIGGATSLAPCGLTSHPMIVCSALDWGSAPGFLRATHLRDPLDPDRKPAELFVPCRCILFAVEAPAGPPAGTGSQAVPQKMH